MKGRKREHIISHNRGGFLYEVTTDPTLERIRKSKTLEDFLLGVFHKCLENISLFAVRTKKNRDEKKLCPFC